MPTVLITGGAGFIGSHIVEAYAARSWPVTVIDDLSTGKAENVPVSAKLIEASVESSQSAAIVKSSRFDLIVHCAAQMDVRKSVADPLSDLAANVAGTVNLLEAARRNPHPPRVIFLSTGGAVYGDRKQPPYEEGFPKEPNSPYAIAKLACEYYLAYYARTFGMQTATLRLANVYGPRQDALGEAGVVAIFSGRILAQDALTVYGTGKQTRDYVYVDDVVRAVEAVEGCDLPPADTIDSRAYNIGTGRATTVNDLAGLLQKAAGSAVGVRHAPFRPGEQLTSFLSNRKAAAELAWAPRVPLEQGLQLTFDWFRRQGAASPSAVAHTEVL